MKGKTIMVFLVVLAVLAVGTVYAFGYRGSSKITACQNIDIEKVKQFQNETLSQREDLMTKKLELRKECGKEVPDANRISALKQEIREIKAGIKEAANKYDVDLRCLKGRHGAGRMGPCGAQ